MTDNVYVLSNSSKDVSKMMGYEIDQIKSKENLFKRIFNKLQQIINPDDILSEDVKLAFDIFKEYLNNPDYMYLLNTDISGEKYIVPKSYYSSNEQIEIDTCIILNSYDRRITIINNKYKYILDIPAKTFNIMVKMFEDKIQEERLKMKNAILKNTIKNLEIILQNLNKNKNNNIN